MQVADTYIVSNWNSLSKLNLPNPSATDHAYMVLMHIH